MFAFASEGALFEFEYTKPHFEPLFALPPNNTPRKVANLKFFVIPINIYFLGIST